MKAVEFCYWLQGYFELTSITKPLSVTQTEEVRKHLALVFKHEIDPSYPNQEALNEIHNPFPNHGVNTRPDDGLIRC